MLRVHAWRTKMKTSLRPNASRPLLAASLAVLIAFGCSDQGTEPPTSPVATPDLSARAGQSSASQQDLGPALAAQKRHGDRLMVIPGVVGHGVGVDDDGNPTITVFTLKPGVEGIPAKLDDVPTRTVVSGQFVAGELIDPPGPAAPNGYSIGHPDITAGTLGAVVQDAGGVCYILSNNHVLANVNKAAIGDNILQPGPFDGGQDPEDAIATLAAFEPILFGGSDTNTIDAAIAEVFTPVADFVTAETPNYAPSSKVTTATIGLGVKKVGRTTELTTGEVTEVNASVNVCYQCNGPFCFSCKKLAYYEGQIMTTDMSDGGDSGSLTVDTNNQPVGLLFAGSSTRTIHNHIADVLGHFNNATVISDLTSCTNGGTPVDNPPSVTVTNPTNGSTVSGTVTVTADASDDNGVTQVEFFVDGSPIGIDTDGPWSTSWDTGTLGDGSSHTVSAEATDDIGQTTASANVTVTVDNSVPPPPGVTVSSIGPNTMQAGTTINNVTIIGSGFADGTSVSFENGSGPAPTASNVVMVDENMIRATVTAKGGGPRRNRVWDVRVTNLDNSSGALVGGFTVTP